MKIRMTRLTLWQNVKVPIGEELEVAPWLADAMIRRSVAVSVDIIKQEAAPPTTIKEQSKPPDEQAAKGKKRGD